MARISPSGGSQGVAALAGRSDEGFGWVRRATDTVGPFVSIALVLIAWEVAAQNKVIIPFLLPALSVVVMRIVGDLLSGQLLLDIALTLYRTAVAFGLASVIGVGLGIVIARNGFARWFCDPLVSIGLPMPKIALLPVFMLWFGLFDASKILMVAFSASFQIIIATWSATRGVERELLWSARSLGASDRRVLWEVILPAALPQILTGLQVAMPICLIVVLVTEMAMGGRGLGDSMLSAARYVDSPGVFAGIVEIGLLGFAVIKGMAYLRRVLLRWHQEAMREDSA
jgi:ABC-type nitrate/sulfonate/bicarbonate transport system permease component